MNMSLNKRKQPKTMTHNRTLAKKPGVVKLPEIAAYLRVHEATARKFCKQWLLRGDLPIHKVGREWWIDRRAWDAFCLGRERGQAA